MKNNKTNSTSYKLQIDTSLSNQATNKKEAQNNQVKPLNTEKSNPNNLKKEKSSRELIEITCNQFIQKLVNSTSRDQETLEDCKKFLETEYITKEMITKLLHCLEDIEGIEHTKNKKNIKSEIIITKLDNAIKKIITEKANIKTITEEYKSCLNLPEHAIKYSSSLAITGIREYHLNTFNEKQLNLVFSPLMIKYLDLKNFKSAYWLAKSSSKDQKKSILLGNGLGAICNYLSNKEISLLVSTSKSMRDNVKIFKNNFNDKKSIVDLSKVVNEFLKNRAEFLSLFKKGKFEGALELLKSTDAIAFYDISASEPNLCKIVANGIWEQHFNDGGDYWRLDETLIINIFQLLMKKGGLQDITIEGNSNILSRIEFLSNKEHYSKTLYFLDLLNIINAKPVKLINTYVANPIKFDLNTTDALGETILLEALSDLTPDQSKVEFVKLLINNGADANKPNSITGERPLKRLLQTILHGRQNSTKEQEDLLACIITALKANPDNLKYALSNIKDLIINKGYHLSHNTLNMLLDEGFATNLYIIINMVSKDKAFTESLAESIINKLQNNAAEFNYAFDWIINSSLNCNTSDNILVILLHARLDGVEKLSDNLLSKYFAQHYCSLSWWEKPKSSKFIIYKLPYFSDNNKEYTIHSLFIDLMLKIRYYYDESSESIDNTLEYLINKLKTKPNILKKTIEDISQKIRFYFDKLSDKALKILFDAGLDSNKLIIEAVTAAITAAKEDKKAEKIIELIIDKTIDINKADENGVTVLEAVVNFTLNKLDNPIELSKED